MHHLLTGRDPQLEPPFSFPPLRSLAPEVSERTASVVMRALDQDVAKRPHSARAMLDQLPPPPAKTLASASGIGMAGSATPAGAGAMATVVLQRPVPVLAAVAPHAPQTPPLPAPPIAASARAKRASVPPQQMALLETQRSLTLPQQAPLAKPAPLTVSSTAKTHDLGLKPANPPQSRVRANSIPIAPPRSASRPAQPRVASPPLKDDSIPNPALRTAATSRDQAAPTTQPRDASWLESASAGNRNGAVHTAMSGPRLIVINGGPQFGLPGSRAVIGRALNPSDVVDIDLSGLRGRGADRVSRRHAEIIRHGMDYFIRDLGSLNGTYISGQGRLGRDQLYKLKDRDEVVLGGAKLEFRKA
jgi:hypothetical protein